MVECPKVNWVITEPIVSRNAEGTNMQDRTVIGGYGDQTRIRNSGDIKGTIQTGKYKPKIK